MGIIENIQKKPQKEKVRLIWTAVIVVAVAMVIIWIFTAKFAKSTPKDMTLFKTISNGVKDFKNNIKKWASVIHRQNLEDTLKLWEI